MNSLVIATLQVAKVFPHVRNPVLLFTSLTWVIRNSSTILQKIVGETRYKTFIVTYWSLITYIYWNSSFVRSITLVGVLFLVYLVLVRAFMDSARVLLGVAWYRAAGSIVVCRERRKHSLMHGIRYQTFFYRNTSPSTSLRLLTKKLELQRNGKFVLIGHLSRNCRNVEKFTRLRKWKRLPMTFCNGQLAVLPLRLFPVWKVAVVQVILVIRSHRSIG